MTLEDRLFSIRAKGYRITLKNHLMYVPGEGHREGWTITGYAQNPRDSIHAGVYESIEETVAELERRIEDQS